MKLSIIVAHLVFSIKKNFVTWFLGEKNKQTKKQHVGDFVNADFHQVRIVWSPLRKISCLTWGGYCNVLLMTEGGNCNVLFSHEVLQMRCGQKKDAKLKKNQRCYIAKVNQNTIQYFSNNFRTYVESVICVDTKIKLKQNVSFWNSTKLLLFFISAFLVVGRPTISGGVSPHHIDRTVDLTTHPGKDSNEFGKFAFVWVTANVGQSKR